MGVQLLTYNTDNVILADNYFNDTQSQRLNISHCGFNVHHQNGRSEKQIRDFQDRPRVRIMQVVHNRLEAI